MGADDAQAVGTEIADAPGLGGGFDLRLDFLPLVPHFLAAGGNDNDAWDFGLAALPHDLRHPRMGTAMTARSMGAPTEVTEG